jgi:hypothetical protein
MAAEKGAGSMSNRTHECVHDTPVRYSYVKLPTSAQCEELHCYWQRYAVDSTVEATRDVRALAIHHAKATRHKVTVHLRQEIRLTPEGEPIAVGAAPAGLAAAP